MSFGDVATCRVCVCVCVCVFCVPCREDGRKKIFGYLINPVKNRTPAGYIMILLNITAPDLSALRMHGFVPPVLHTSSRRVTSLSTRLLICRCGQIIDSTMPT
jgi:hypothetical protein